MKLESAKESYRFGLFEYYILHGGQGPREGIEFHPEIDPSRPFGDLVIYFTFDGIENAPLQKIANAAIALDDIAKEGSRQK